MVSIKSVDIKLGYTCNNNCIHCVVAGHVERLLAEKKPIDRTTDEVKKHILDAKSKGAMSVVFTGGEVTIRPDFLELLKFAKSKGLKPLLQTNGRSFCIKQFAQKTLEIAPELHFEVALHSSKKEIHDRITNVNGSFDQTLRGIKNLISSGSRRVNFKVVISRHNFRDLKDIVALAEEMGVRQVDIAFPHGMGNARKNWFDIVPRYEEIHEYVLEAASFADKNDVNVTFEAIPFCFLDTFVSYSSEIKYLRTYLKGETTELRQIDNPVMDWQKKRLSIKSKPVQCKTCKYFNICEGVWCEYLELYGGKEFSPVKGTSVQFSDMVWCLK